MNVTNAKDKEAMLPKILKVNEHVVETFQRLAPEYSETQSEARTTVFRVRGCGTPQQSLAQRLNQSSAPHTSLTVEFTQKSAGSYTSSVF